MLGNSADCKDFVSSVEKFCKVAGRSAEGAFIKGDRMRRLGRDASTAWRRRFA